MNKNDSAIIRHLLGKKGMLEVDHVTQADIVIINTCSVRDHAEQRALGHIATLRSWREQPGRILVVVGCMAQRCASFIMNEYPFVDLVLGPDSYRSITEKLKAVRDKQTRIRETELHDELYNGIYPQSSGVSDFISIMRGCNNYCSYCVVPYVRGPVRSRPVMDIIAQVSTMVKNGVREITLLGQNVNEYDHKGNDFAGLLEQVSRMPGLCRVRFLTSHPKDLTDKIINTIARESVLCEWFHIPMQSGNDRILALMNRQYTIGKYRDLVRTIRKKIPNATVTTDIIVGFPTETDREYRDTIEVVKEIQFDDAYMYRYSSRPGTAAAGYDMLPEKMIKNRLHDLIIIQNEIVTRKTKLMIGHTYEVLFEVPARQGGMRGKTRGNKDVIVAMDVVPGTTANVKIEKVIGRTPTGAIVP